MWYKFFALMTLLSLGSAPRFHWPPPHRRISPPGLTMEYTFTKAEQLPQPDTPAPRRPQAVKVVEVLDHFMS